MDTQESVEIITCIRKAPKFWRKKIKEKCLTSTDIEDFLKLYIPKLYRITFDNKPEYWDFKEHFHPNTLFKAFDDFIYNGNFPIIKQLNKKDNNSPSVCSKVFDEGDFTYFCKECGINKTFTLCSECFRNSEHRHHNYKMCISDGADCCACGSAEAWKKDCFCKWHTAGVSEKEQSEYLTSDFKERTAIVFKTILWYAYRLLTIDEDTGIRQEAVYDIFRVNLFRNDTFCTILYNDNRHTAKEIIETLTSVSKYKKRRSSEFATKIEKTGRAVIKCSTLLHCLELKSKIELFTSREGKRPMKVLVNHAHVTSHQIYALKLLSWLDKYLGRGESFRKIFADQLMTRQGEAPSIGEIILLKSRSWWKMHRFQWHKLIISGMFLEYENKKVLAKAFAKHYKHIIENFIHKENDQVGPIYPLLSQLLAVPKLARHLIAYDNIYQILLSSFLSECVKKCNPQQLLDFQMKPVTEDFVRSFCILKDLGRLLSVIPGRWTDELRQGFLQGMPMLLQIFTMMEGMDPFTREVHLHIEYEPDWQAGFNLQHKLTSCISLVAGWCGSDKDVLVETYRSVLEKIKTNKLSRLPEVRDYYSMHYDVLSRPVSIHIPLTRFLAALYLHFDDPQFRVKEQMPDWITESVIRAQVMKVQVKAGMWTRNGLSLVNTLHLYHRPEYRTEMLDRDISLLQAAAARFTGNEFLFRVLYKLDISEWFMGDFDINTSIDPEKCPRPFVKLIDGFLDLILAVIGERHVPGVSNITVEDRIRKEIIQYLCIKPLSHSELTKKISDNLTTEVKIDQLIKEVAVFKKPTHTTGKGVYELKEQYYDEFNIFYYHYTPEELSQAEETQIRRRKAKGEIQCCPPPKLPKLNESFEQMINILQCEITLRMMRTVLKAGNYSHSLLHKVLHLIGYALLEEETNNYPFFKFIENAARPKLILLLKDLLKTPLTDSLQELVNWTVTKYKQLANAKQKVCVTLEKESCFQQVENEKNIRAKLAAERRAKLLKQMERMQMNFVKDNLNAFAEASNKPNTSRGNKNMNDTEVFHEDERVALGPNQSRRITSEKTYVCILCLNEEKVRANGPLMVLAGFVQLANVFRPHALFNYSRFEWLLNSQMGPVPHTNTCGHAMHYTCFQEYLDIVEQDNRIEERLRQIPRYDNKKQEFLCPLCECLSNAVLPLLPSLSGLQTTAPKSDLTFDQWIENIHTVLRNKVKTCHGRFKCDSSDVCQNMHCSACVHFNRSSTENISNAQCEVNRIQHPYEVFYSYELSPDLPKEFVQLFPTEFVVLDKSYLVRVNSFAKLLHTINFNSNPLFADNRIAPISWASLAYTIHTIETLLRDSNKPLLGQLTQRQQECIDGFIRIMSMFGSTSSSSIFINGHAVRLLSILFKKGNTSITDWDSFGCLVSLTFAVPSLICKYTPVPIPTGGTLDLYLLRLIFTAHIVKEIVLFNGDSETLTDTATEAHPELVEILKILGKTAEGISTIVLWKRVQYACLPFLRCCVLFYHYLTEVPAPKALTEVGGDTFENLCSYLDLPQNPKDLFSSTLVKELVKHWSGHSTLYNLARTECQINHDPHAIPRLVELPTDYSVLIDIASTFTCPVRKKNETNPLMCLICRKVFCSCTHYAHATRYEAGVGIFLEIRKCQILLVASDMACYIAAPYVDDYAETDQGLCRKNPLRLCPDRYRNLQLLWLNHGMHEEIARSDHVFRV